MATAETSDGRTLSGLVAPFDQTTTIGNRSEGHFRETLKPGCFRKTLSERAPAKIPMLWQHGRDSAVGGTLPVGVYTHLEERADGLYAEGRVFQNAHAEAVREAVAAGAVGGASIGFRVISEVWMDSDGKRLHGESIWRAMARPGSLIDRLVTEVALIEISLTATPAYSGTAVGVRNRSTTTIPRDTALAKLRLLDEL
ncbi:HK97 family phage prohead protease [Nocardia sp. NBC_01329]|uniref:HK97 family phage prohead protease n=1 Tax=Nocardia sp. NBC_01329 TaxID=2903594 RepID=UPI002E0DFB43|nr:HK97 family phage prohead protease [Nocardia sp. NBC_01329]